MKKILILGSSGSGKTYLGNILSKKLKIKQYDLDDIKYKRKFDIGRTKEEKIKLITKLTKKSSWIMTGISFSWIDRAVESADKIIMLKRNIFLESYRVIKRFLKRKYDPKPPKENIAGLCGLIK